MTAKIEEIVIRSDASDLEQFAPHGGNALFSMATGFDKRRNRVPGNAIRQRQCPAIDLATRRQWQCIEQHDRARQHMFGQDLRQ